MPGYLEAPATYKRGGFELFNLATFARARLGGHSGTESPNESTSFAVMKTFKFSRTLVRFAMVGIVNTAVGLGVIFAAKWTLGMGDLKANAIGYSVGLACSFILNRSWTFEHKGRAFKAARRFVVAVGIAYALNLVAVLGLKHFGEVNSYLAQAAGVIPYTIFLYLASRLYVFPEAHSSSRVGNSGDDNLNR